MSDQPQEKKLSEIGHLFLSSIRAKASNGSPAPKRIPPGGPRAEAEMDLTPEEFAQVFADDEEIGQSAEIGSGPIPEITAVIGSHLNGKQLDRVREYARHLTADGSRIGLIEVDASEFRLVSFGGVRGCDDAQPADPAPSESFDARRMSEALNEMSADVDRWLLLLPNPRIPEARAILRTAARWVLLCTSDHDGVVACYRTLKGLSDLWPAGSAKPRLSVALLDAEDEDHAQRITTKLAGVCGQFLNWPLEAETPVHAAADAGEHLVLFCRPLRDKTQIAGGPHWQIVSEFLTRPMTSAGAREESSEGEQFVQEASAMDQKKWAQRLAPSVVEKADGDRAGVAGVIPAAAPPPVPVPAPALVAAPQAFVQAQGPRLAAAGTRDSDVIDLAGDADDAAILSAVLHAHASDLVECPIAPPMCPTARLAVGRDRRIVLVAVAKQGLAELHTIGSAFRWLSENRSLIGMAVPQLSIDTTQPPQLSLFIDQADSSASTLGPIMQSSQVTVRTYRTLRWSGKRGLLLEAA